MRGAGFVIRKNGRPQEIERKFLVKGDFNCLLYTFQVTGFSIGTAYDFEMKNRVLEIFKDGQVAWINELMQKCGVISSEQPVQEHTCIVTDAKKREYPDRPGTIPEKLLEETVSGGIWHNRGCGLW